jgi:glycosyltransferase involved in cell wall biosynthesis
MKLKKKIVIGISATTSTTLIKGQLNYFVVQGYEVFLLAPSDSRSLQFCVDEGATLLAVPMERDISLFKDLKSLLIIIRHFINIKPDVVNVGTPKVGLLGMLASFLLRVPRRIYTCRGFRFEHEHGVKKKILMMMERVAGMCAQDIICISPSIEELGLKLKVFEKKKTVVINKGSSNGIEISRFDATKIPIVKTEELKKELHLENCFVFGFVGRLNDRKGVKEAYEAFNKMYLTNTKLRFIFVGAMEMDQITDTMLLNNIISHPGILYLGSKKDVPLYLSLMDVFVLPSWSEGFGNVLVEAAAMGLPVISTDATGCKDAVSNGYNGVLVQLKSVEALVNAMEYLYNDEETRRRFGANGVNWANNFDSKIIWSRMESLYKNDKLV